MLVRLEERALSSALPGILLLAISLAQPLVLVPVLLSGWGDVRYGVWIILTSTAVTLQSLDAGFQGYAGNEFNQAYAREPSRLRHMVSSALRVSYGLGAVHLCMGAGLLVTGVFDHLLPTGISIAEISDARGAFLVMVIHWAIQGSITGLVGRVFAPVGLYARSQWWGVISRTGYLIAIAVSASLGAGLTLAWVVAAVVSLIVCAAFVVDVQRKLGKWLSWWRDGSFGDGLSYFVRSLVLSAVGLAEGALATGLLIVLGSSLQAGGLAIFATLRTMSGLLGQVAMMVVNPITPDLVRFVVQRDAGKLTDTLRVLRLLIVTFGGCALCGLAAIAAPLYEIWTLGALAFDYAAFALLGWAAFVRLAGLPEVITLRSLNQNHLVLLLVGIQGLVLFSALAVLREYPLTWVAAAAIAGTDFITGWALPRYLLTRELRSYGMNTVTEKWREVWFFLFVGAALAAGVGVLGRIVMVLLAMSGAGIYAIQSWRKLSPIARERLLALGHRLVPGLGRLTKPLMGNLRS